MTIVRPERPDDLARIREVNERAFGQPVEADLVDRLRQACADAVSLVAEDGGVVGHILFTPVVVEGARQSVTGMGLGPMAVVPDRQRQGIGVQLVRHGLDIVRERGYPFVVVVGHPVLPALRIRGGVQARPSEPMGGNPGRGIHGSRPRRPRDGGSVWRGTLPGRVQRGHYRRELRLEPCSLDVLLGSRCLGASVCRVLGVIRRRHVLDALLGCAQKILASTPMSTALVSRLSSVVRGCEGDDSHSRP